jgi:UDP-glucuronate 4-epimerase
VTLFGDSVQLRDFTYVGDVARAVVSAVTAQVPSGTILNVAMGSPVPVPEVLRLIEGEVRGEAEVSRQPHRAGDTGSTHGDSRAAAAGLGWRPTTDLQLGLKHQVAWHRGLRDPSPAGAGVPDVEPALQQGWSG